MLFRSILVYPQEVTASTVEMDTEKYATWLMENIEDERFNAIRMQGHSHVRMGPTPSSVDLNHQEEILQMLGDNDFYIFMIWNKSFASNIKVYDMKENTLFENSDVSVKILDEVGDLNEFLADAKAMVKDRVYSYNSYRAPGSTAAAAATTSKPAGTSGPYNPLAPTTQGGKVTSITPPASGDKPRTRIGAGWYGKNAGQQAIDGFGEDGENPWSSK